MSSIVDRIIRERSEKYGDAWIAPTRALDAIVDHDMSKLVGLVLSGHFYNWFMILGKLCRAVFSPNFLDHWVDIAGYAQLSIDHAKKQEDRDVLL